MANKQDRFYFDNFLQAADLCCKAADYLVECLNNYDVSNMKPMLEKMHSFEHAADGKKHEMSATLARAFVTPLDREDLADISQNIDEVADCVEEVLQRFYINDIHTVTADALEFAAKIAECCHMMKQMLVEFESFKKPATLHKMIIELSHKEEECDQLYLEAARRLRVQGADVMEIFSWREIYDRMERCADACEHVADSVETIVMKNT